jgi:ABC-type transporter Mla maintaining outer membrane lipid asymmetry ATPase subunit MlaF
MYPTIESGDLIICHVEDAKDVEVGDVISFFDPAGNGKSIVTHRVLEIETQDGKIFILKAEEEILSELQKQQGYLLKLSGKIIEAKSKSLFDKDQFEVVEWSKVLDSE